MSSLTKHLNNLTKQHGGSGIPFSEFMKNKSNKSNKSIKSRRKNIRKKSSRSPSRKRKVTRRTKKRKVTRTKKKQGKSNKSKKCKCGHHTYTSIETTPRGLGICEECIPLNVIMKGRDGYLYENKNHQWIKFN